MSTQLFGNVLVIGAGLIGGSLAKAIREQSLAAKVVGFGRNQQSLQQGVELGVLDAACSDLDIGIAEADLIVLGVPTLTVGDYVKRIAEHKKPSAIVTDVASVKGDVEQAVIKALGQMPSWFVLGHPIAGSEASGITASNAQLFEHHKVIVTPVEGTDVDALSKVESLWQQVGADVVQMDVDRHDRVLAATSHVPHALAFSLVDTLCNMDEHDDVFRFAAGGFRDFTRIASSHPVMWHDIMLANKSAVIDVLHDFQTTLKNLEKMIESDDSESMLAMFEKAKSARDEFAERLAARKRKNISESIE